MKISDAGKQEVESALNANPRPPCGCGATLRNMCEDLMALPYFNIEGAKQIVPLVMLTCDKCGRIDLHQLGMIAPQEYARGPVSR